MSTAQHLPDCTTVAASDVAREYGCADPGRFAAIGFLRCADGCPELERVLQQARELAKRCGW